MLALRFASCPEGVDGCRAWAFERSGGVRAISGVLAFGKGTGMRRGDRQVSARQTQVGVEASGAACVPHSRCPHGPMGGPAPRGCAWGGRFSGSWRRCGGDVLEASGGEVAQCGAQSRGERGQARNAVWRVGRQPDVQPDFGDKALSVRRGIAVGEGRLLSTSAKRRSLRASRPRPQVGFDEFSDRLVAKGSAHLHPRAWRSVVSATLGAQARARSRRTPPRSPGSQDTVWNEYRVRGL